LVAPKGAAVAAILRFVDDRAEVLLMKRASRGNDRWSGQVSFPGGREEPDDPDLLATAVRETREEVGLALNDCARLIGRLDMVRAIGQGRFLPMAITPYVFLQTRDDPMTLNDEAELTFWLPLDQVVSGDLAGTHEYKMGPIPMHFPCWNYSGQVVWGLTYKMIEALLDIVQ
jgi:8-oxo-dGTP pyrophosphatase MutT (NUDIX family)